MAEKRVRNNVQIPEPQFDATIPIWLQRAYADQKMIPGSQLTTNNVSVPILVQQAFDHPNLIVRPQFSTHKCGFDESPASTDATKSEADSGTAIRAPRKAEKILRTPIANRFLQRISRSKEP